MASWLKSRAATAQKANPRSEDTPVVAISVHALRRISGWRRHAGVAASSARLGEDAGSPPAVRAPTRLGLITAPEPAAQTGADQCSEPISSTTYVGAFCLDDCLSLLSSRSVGRGHSQDART